MINDLRGTRVSVAYLELWPQKIGRSAKKISLEKMRDKERSLKKSNGLTSKIYKSVLFPLFKLIKKT